VLRGVSDWGCGGVRDAVACLAWLQLSWLPLARALAFAHTPSLLTPHPGCMSLDAPHRFNAQPDSSLAGCASLRQLLIAHFCDYVKLEHSMTGARGRRRCCCAL
jgi:hypothetical protein